jgi:hypothetical protein
MGLMTIASIVAVATSGALLRCAWHAFEEYRVRRKALAMIRQRLPGLKSIPLSRTDKRGFENGPDGWMRPR